MPDNSVKPKLTKEQVIKKIENNESLKGYKLEKLDFSNFVFENQPNFTSVDFVDVCFKQAKFKKGAIFDKANFFGKANFQSTHFLNQGIASFEQAKFYESAHFGGTQFFGQANFSRAEFAENNMAILNAANFYSSAQFLEARFLGEANFILAKFFDRVDFTKANFCGKAHFNEVEFLDKENRGINSSFIEANFCDETYFNKTKFSHYIDFLKASFTKEADFSNVAFFSKVNFRENVFGKKVVFKKTYFYKTSLWSNAEFKGEADFFAAQFFELAHFVRSKFLNDVRFFGARFYGYIVFGGLEENKIFQDDKLVNFGNVTFSKEKKGKFQHVSLKGASFINTSLENVIFTDVEWNKKGRWVWKCNIVFDEKKVDEKKNWPLVERIYRHLKVNYETKGDYTRAGDFHYGEMELQRKALGRWTKWGYLSMSFGWLYRNVFSINAWYKYLSGYGEKWGQTLFFLLLSFSMFAGVNMISGIQTVSGERLFVYEFTGATEALFNKFFWHDLKIACHYTFYTLILKNDPKYISIHSNTGWIILQSIFGPTLVTLFVLAIKRKFKR